MAKKIYILDTNVLLHDSESMLSFQDNTVVIPLKAIEELDTFKSNSNELGRNARRCSRILDELRQKGTLTNGGVELENGGRIRVALVKDEDIERLPLELRKNKNGDNAILGVAMRIASQNDEMPVIVVTKDVNFRIKAAAVQLKVEDYKTDRVSFDELYTGHESISVLSQDIDKLYKDGELCIDELSHYDDSKKSEVEFLPNKCLTLTGAENGKQSALVTVTPDRSRLVKVHRVSKQGVWGIEPRNREQEFALELLLNPNIPLVSLIGKAGTGKTLLAIAAGLAMTTDENVYRRVLVSRPVFPMGRDIGFLPGEIEEKLAPWMQPIFDNVDLLLNGVEGLALEKGATKGSRGYQTLVDMGVLQVEALTYIRGRSIPRQYMIVDEAQNLTPHEIKTIITRAGEGTKIVLTGDPDQIDNPFINAESNGLSYTVDRFKAEKIGAHMTLKNGERSELAEVASNIL